MILTSAWLRAPLLCNFLQVALSVTDGTGKFEPWLHELWASEGYPHDPAPQDAPLELRVSKGLGPKGYNKVRVSLISHQLEDFADFKFSYKQQFKHRWTENFLHSILMDLNPGANKLSIGGRDVVIDLPAENEGIRGVFWSDPCFSSKWIHCAYAERFQVYNRSIDMLNVVYKDPSMNFFSVLGDNFYDQTGELAKTIMPRLSADVKRRFLLMVNGNHDNWVCGSPGCATAKDNFGIGQMQYYAADTAASIISPQDDVNFYDLSANPDDGRDITKSWPNTGTNFLQYHKLGNIGFLSFSGADDFDKMKPHFVEACNYLVESKPSVVLLLGHWNHDGMGCEGTMAVPAVYEELLKMKECSALHDRLKYMDGHEHCNFVQARDSSQQPYGFMIGAHGMNDGACSAQYGFAFLDSTGGRVKLHYFEVDSDKKGDRYQQIVDCVKSLGGLDKCTQFAETWLDVAADDQSGNIIEV